MFKQSKERLNNLQSSKLISENILESKFADSIALLIVGKWEIYLILTVAGNIKYPDGI